MVHAPEAGMVGAIVAFLLILAPPATPMRPYPDLDRRERGGGGHAHNNRARPSKDSSRDAGLSYLVDSTIEVVTNDGRVIVGVLRGYDQVMNIILDESHERVYSAKQGVECVVLGLQVIRGDNIALVGEVDVERDTAIDLAKVHAKPLNAVVH